MSHQLTRRGFVKAGAAATAGLATALSATRAYAANDRVRLAFIGVGNRGGQLIEATTPNDDAEIVAVCDVFQPYAQAWCETLGGDVAVYSDFRELLGRDDIDAVVIATPDHWHAVQTIMACDAGKDVFVEKPLAMTVAEGRAMVDAARRNRRIVQVGVHRRSSPMYAGLAEFVQDGGIGKVTVCRAYRLSNMYPTGIGRAPDGPPPEGLDWDLWLGPSAERPFNANIAPYKFRWWEAYSSQMANWGVHYFDLLRWILNEDAPESVSAHGGKFAVQDDRDIPDTLHATFEFASGRLLLFGQYEASGHPMFPSGAEIELRGTDGVIYAGRRGWQVIPERGGQFQHRAPRIESKEVRSEDGNLTQQHMRDFIDCVKSGHVPNADVEEGHRSTVFAQLGNIALATEARLRWDAENERVTNNDAANNLLHCTYREPWRSLCDI